MQNFVELALCEADAILIKLQEKMRLKKQSTSLHEKFLQLLDENQGTSIKNICRALKIRFVYCKRLKKQNSSSKKALQEEVKDCQLNSLAFNSSNPEFINLSTKFNPILQHEENYEASLNTKENRTNESADRNSNQQALKDSLLCSLKSLSTNDLFDILQKNSREYLAQSKKIVDSGKQLLEIRQTKTQLQDEMRYLKRIGHKIEEEYSNISEWTSDIKKEIKQEEEYKQQEDF